MGITAEPLDILLKQGLVTARQHAAGMRLRWLYTLRFGVPDVRSVDLEGGRSSGGAARSDAWQQRHEQEYLRAMAAMRTSGAGRCLISICICRQWPLWLVELQMAAKPLEASARHELRRLVQGLDAVAGVERFQASGKVPDAARALGDEK